MKRSEVNFDNLKNCPDVEDLVEFRRGTLPGEKYAAVKQHLVSCSECEDFVLFIDDPDAFYVEPEVSRSQVQSAITHFNQLKRASPPTIAVAHRRVERRSSQLMKAAGSTAAERGTKRLIVDNIDALEQYVNLSPQILIDVEKRNDTWIALFFLRKKELPGKPHHFVEPATAKIEIVLTRLDKSLVHARLGNSRDGHFHIRSTQKLVNYQQAEENQWFVEATIQPGAYWTTDLL